MELDDGKSRINGTKAPTTVGTNVIFGCVRLGNDDVVDLYGRVQSRHAGAGELDAFAQFPLFAVRTSAASSLLKRGASS